MSSGGGNYYFAIVGYNDNPVFEIEFVPISRTDVKVNLKKNLGIHLKNLQNLTFGY